MTEATIRGADVAAPAALFARQRDGSFRVRVWSDEDLTGQHVVVKRKNGTCARVRLTALVFAATAERRDALYDWHRDSPEEKALRRRSR